MKHCTHTLTALGLAAGLTLGSFALAQDGPPPQQKVPPSAAHGMEGIAHGLPNAGDKTGISADAMAADQVVSAQNAKWAAAPEEMGDAHFALVAGCGNMEEIALSKLVAEKASDPKVKELANTIASEHAMAQEKLAPIAKKLGVVYPDALPSKPQAEMMALKNMPVEKMEKAYLSMMKSEHLKAVSMYTDKAGMLKDADLKAYATETLPHIRMHTGMILQANEAMGMPLDTHFSKEKMDHKM